MKMKNDIVLEKTKGCLVGLACGDYLGMPYEFILPYKVRSYFQHRKLKPLETQVFNKKVTGYYTDDTALMLCLAESLIEKGFDTKDQLYKYQQWLTNGFQTPDGGRSYGVGQQTLRALNGRLTALEDDKKAGGNGALMRCAPIGLLYYKDFAKLVDYSLKSAGVTHNNSVAKWSCVVHNAFISFAMEGLFKSDYCSLLLSMLPQMPPELKTLLSTNSHKLKSDELQTRGYSLYTLTIALRAFLTTDSFEDCITLAVSVGGDTDTQAAVAGALAGAYYGYSAIPRVWQDVLMRRDYIVDLAMRLRNSEDLVTQIMYILNDVHRTTPAHFMSNGQRKQSFCVDFDIDETDEYQMASEAWNSATDPIDVRIGEDLMLSSYIASKLKGDAHMPELTKRILNGNNIKPYFEHCIEYGKQRALGIY